MITRLLGQTGLRVTQLGFGAMELRGPEIWSGRPVDDAAADAILNAVLDTGINFIDTAVDYGRSEMYIGRYIASRRNEYYLATKCGCDPKDAGGTMQSDHTWTRDTLMRNIHASLDRMHTDHVDVLQLHNPSPDDVLSGDLVSVLEDIRSQGLTRHIGISTTLPHMLQFLEMGAFETYQIPYSALAPMHHDAISMAAEVGAGIIIREGIAVGGPDSELPERAQQAGLSAWAQAGLNELLPHGMKPAELLLRFTLTHPHCHTCIVGTLNVEHLKDNVAAADRGPLDDDLYQEVLNRIAAYAAG
ncbi:MAG: aldo/keto reductase [Planctomycetaceae bacterium]|nr:aldo/keto reductase [Planctomycetaceae bacterium]